MEAVFDRNASNAVVAIVLLLTVGAGILTIFSENVAIGDLAIGLPEGQCK